MALQEGKIIEGSLRRVGLSYSFNDNTSDVYKLATSLFKEILDSVAVRTDLLFNATTVGLTQDGENRYTGEKRFNIPVDFLNKNYFVEGTARMEGEFFYSNDDNVVLNYFRKIQLSEYPDYMYEFLVYFLAVRIAESDSSFEKKLEILEYRLNSELNRLYSQQYVPLVREGD